MSSYNAGTLIAALCLVAPFLFMALWCLTVLSSQPPDSHSGVTYFEPGHKPLLNDLNEYVIYEDTI